MTALLTAAEAQAQGVGLLLSTDALQSLIDAEEAEMIQRFGPHGDGVTQVTVTVRPQGAFLNLPRPFVSITSVTASPYPGGSATAIASDQRYTWGDEGRIELYPSGFYWAVWDARTVATVTYVPADDRALRKMVLLSLVQTATELPVVTGEKVSGLSFSIDSTSSHPSDWDNARATAYQRLVYYPIV